MDIKAIEIKSIEYTQTLTASDLERYLADPWQWRDDVRAQLGLEQPASGNGNGHKPVKKRVAKGTGKKRATKAAPKAGRPARKLYQCPHCDRTFKHQGRLNNHVRDVHGGSSATDSGQTTTWQTEAASAAAS